jgi:glycosyltransferase involved in cell wall biosynthesis
MIRQGAEVFVITRRTSSDLPKRDTVDGIPVERVPPVASRRLAKYLMLFPVFARLVARRRDYDVILVSGLRLLGIPAMLAALLCRKTCILRAASCGELSGAFIWDSPHFQEKRRINWFIDGLIRLRNRLLLKADGFLGVSQAIGEEYQDCGAPPEATTIINNGTDTDTFMPVSVETRRRLKAKLGLPDMRIAAYSGKLNRGKGLDFLLDVWRSFVQQHPDALLLLIGSGGDSFLSYEGLLRRFVAENALTGHVVFTGFVQNVNEYLQCADLFVFPSENEACPNAVVEALACGLPCLASRVGGIPDTVHDEFNGRLLPPRDHAAWLKALEAIWCDPAMVARWGEQGRARIMQHNSMTSVVGRYLDFIRICRSRREAKR